MLDDMAGGFGAGFLTLTLLVVLAGFAMALGLTAATIAIRRRSGWDPAAAAYVATVLVLGVVIAGFGVLVLANESAVGAALLVTPQPRGIRSDALTSIYL